MSTAFPGPSRQSTAGLRTREAIADAHTHTPPATTCSTGGLGGSGTILNKDKNEDGQVSGPIHNQLEPRVDGLAPVVHEVNCDVVVSLGL